MRSITYKINENFDLLSITNFLYFLNYNYIFLFEFLKILIEYN